MCNCITIQIQQIYPSIRIFRYETMSRSGRRRLRWKVRSRFMSLLGGGLLLFTFVFHFLIISVYSQSLFHFHLWLYRIGIGDVLRRWWLKCMLVHIVISVLSFFLFLFLTFFVLYYIDPYLWELADVTLSKEEGITLYYVLYYARQ